MKWTVDYFRYRKEEYKEQKQVKKRFYQDKEFALLDKTLLHSYYFKSPYRISKAEAKKRGDKNLYTYGETPLTTFEVIGKKGNLKKGDRFLELGCGRGRGLFFLSHFFHCETIGIERIAPFILQGKKLAKQFENTEISFLCSDFLDIPLPEVDLIYLYGTALEKREIIQLISRFSALSPGTKIITVSYPLQDYASKKLFETKKVFPLFFPWGKTEGYLQVII